MTVKRCYCLGTICGHDPLANDDRQVHLDAQINWGSDDVRDPWSGSYDFGSFACIQKWAGDRSDDHDGRVLSDGVDPNPVEVSAPPDAEASIDMPVEQQVQR